MKLPWGHTTWLWLVSDITKTALWYIFYLESSTSRRYPYSLIRREHSKIITSWYHISTSLSHSTSWAREVQAIEILGLQDPIYHALTTLVREVGRLTTIRPHNVGTTSAHISWVLRTTSTQHRHTMSTWHTVGAHSVCTTSSQRPRNVGTTSVHSRHTDWLLAGTYKVFTNRLLAG